YSKCLSRRDARQICTLLTDNALFSWIVMRLQTARRKTRQFARLSAAQRRFSGGAAASRTRGRAIRQAGLRPVEHFVGTGIFGGERLVDVDAESGLIVGVHVAVADFRRAGKHLVDQFGEAAPLLNAEIGRP